MQHRTTVISVAAILMVAVTASAQDDAPSIQISEADRPFLLNYPNLEDSDGRIVLTNEYVVLQRLVVPAGKWEGIHSHPGNQIYVHINGGEWSGRLGGETEYSGAISPDGGVGWMDAIPLSAGHNSGNTGDTDIDLIYVTLKKESPIAAEAEHSPQAFPDIELELLLENDRMIVQRAILEPGQWTGEHGHPGNQVNVVVKGGARSERRRGAPYGPSQELPTGSAGWLDALGPGDAHDVGNTGDTTMEIVLVLLK